MDDPLVLTQWWITISFISGARLRFLNPEALVSALASVKEVNELRPQDFECKFELEHCG